MYNAEESKTIATTIAQQIGSRFVPMIGAYNLLSHPEGALSFRFKAQAAQVNGKRPNWVKITLDPMDTYTVEYGRVHGLNFDVLQKDEGVYVDVLRSGIEETLQLRLSMGRIRVAA
jgi:hypothetical protein